MTALCFDIASGGVSAALFNSQLAVVGRAATDWQFQTDKSGAATLSVDTVLEKFKTVLRELKITDPIDAIAIGCFMHGCVLLDADDRPLTPLFTWLDQRGEEGVAYVRSRLGERFHDRTGCRYHPMFPVFKLAALHLRDSALVAAATRVVSPKAYLVHRLTGVWLEDYGMASSWGLFDLQESHWDSGLLSLIGLNTAQLPSVAGRTQIAGQVTQRAAAEFGLTEGTPVINGSGDGFLASAGSDCETPARVAISLGTSAAVRQALPAAVLNSSSGTFCYKADENQFLLGCASNNGGNTLDWARSNFGELNSETEQDVPIFIPLLRGERSPEWDPRLSASFQDLRAHHRMSHMAHAVVEGVIFNLQWLDEILQQTSGSVASEIVLSGNGFLNNLAARILASIAGVPVLIPAEPGGASLRGAALCISRALGRKAPPLQLRKVPPLDNESIPKRYERYKELREHVKFPV
jgi:gluconokinase